MNVNVSTNPENNYAIGRRMKVRKLAGIFEIVDSWMIGKNRRYVVKAIPNTGALCESTESWGADMQPAPDPAPVSEPATASQEHVTAIGTDDVNPGAYDAPEAAHATPGAIFGQDGLDPGAFGGELDPYSVGAQYERASYLEDPGELKDPFKSVRKLPRRPTYNGLKDVVYNARFKGLEDWTALQLETLPEGFPVAVVVTDETNGHAVWIITSEQRDEIRLANLEIFYPRADGSSADAIEYSVLLALRQIPLRSVDLEILLSDFDF